MVPLHLHSFVCRWWKSLSTFWYKRPTQIWSLWCSSLHTYVGRQGTYYHSVIIVMTICMCTDFFIRPQCISLENMCWSAGQDQRTFFNPVLVRPQSSCSASIWKFRDHSCGSTSKNLLTLHFFWSARLSIENPALERGLVATQEFVWDLLTSITHFEMFRKAFIRISAKFPNRSKITVWNCSACLLNEVPRNWVVQLWLREGWSNGWTSGGNESRRHCMDAAAMKYKSWWMISLTQGMGPIQASISTRGQMRRVRCTAWNHLNLRRSGSSQLMSTDV